MTVPMPLPLRDAIEERAKAEGRSKADIARLILTAVLLDPDDQQQGQSR